MKSQSYLLFLMRLALGWIFLYAGYTKIIDSKWSAAGYLNNAKSFSGFYHWLAQPGMIGITNFVNEWGLTILGICLILGLFVRYAGVAAAVLMILYYLPVLDFPRIAPHSLLIDDHIVYAIGALLLASAGAGRIWGLDSVMGRRSQ